MSVGSSKKMKKFGSMGVDDYRREGGSRATSGLMPGRCGGVCGTHGRVWIIRAAGLLVVKLVSVVVCGLV